MFINLRILLFLLPMFANAGLFDFQKISQLYSSYEAKDYNRSREILHSLKEETPVYYYNAGDVNYKLGRYQEAVQSYKRAFGEGVDEHNRLYNLSNAYFKLKEYKKALSVFEIALKIRDEEDTRYNLELTKKLLQKKKEQKKSDKKKQKEKSVQKSKKKSDKESKKKVKKLTQKELQKLNEMQKRLQRKKQLKKMLEKSFEDRKVPVIMYPLNKKVENREKPW